jgi:hypothetical protein
MKKYGVGELASPFLTSELDEGDWSAPITHCIEGWVDHSWSACCEEQNLLPLSGIEPWLLS